FYAQRAAVPFVLFESSAELGGLCRTFRCGPHRYDAGAHRFHDRDAEITRDLRELLGDELLRVRATSQICDRGRYFDFPPRPLNWICGSGVREAAGTVVEILRGLFRPRPEHNFEDLAI